MAKPIKIKGVKVLKLTKADRSVFDTVISPRDKYVVLYANKTKAVVVKSKKEVAQFKKSLLKG